MFRLFTIRTGLTAGALIYCSLSLASAPADAVHVTGNVESVTVYSDRAVVKRRLPLSGLTSGGRLVVTGLPKTVVKESIRASAAGASVTGVSVRSVVRDPEARFKNHPLQLKLNELNDALAVESNKIRNAEAQLSTLDSFSKLSTAQTDRDARSGDIRPGLWNNALEFIGKKRDLYFERIRNAQKKKRELSRELIFTRAELSRLKNEDNRAGLEVDINYQGVGAGSKVYLQYMVTGVSWRSRFDLRGSSKGGNFEIIAQATIRQSSGEDWENCKITLTTARPSIGTNPGVLHPWRVNGAGMTNGRSGGAAGTNTSTSPSPDGQSPAGEGAATASITTQLAGLKTIRGDASDHKVMLKKGISNSKLSFVAIPSLSSYVFLKARLKNTSGLPILDDEINIYLDGNYMGKSDLKYRAAVGEEFGIYLGPDQRMQLKRTLVKGDVASSGIFTDGVKVQNKWEIEVANYTGRKIDLEVLDQYPIPADPRISTEFDGSSHTLNRKTGTGILAWKPTVAPGKKLKLDFAYSMTFPKEMWDGLVAQTRSQEEDTVQDEALGVAPASQSKRYYNLEQMLNK